MNEKDAALFAGDVLRQLIKENFPSQEEFAYEYHADIRTINRYINEGIHPRLNTTKTVLQLLLPNLYHIPRNNKGVCDMGWAKYYEDNVEIMYERQATMEARRQENKINVVCTTVLPMTNIIIEIKEELIAPKQVEYEDRYIICKDCGRKFLFSSKEQKHFDKMDWDDPKRCKCCRSYRNTRYLMCSSF